ncbi:CobW family GTP-binding protein [Halobacteriovorax marinus]|uniref:CobW family GTP-binding protein n=1 Tax=Halobacteriovorax marinus TaxID=97084 RepID=UPI003A8E2FA3
MQELIPVTLVVGFLGSGKTTFINEILNGDHGKKIAVIENEFGEVGIDDEILSGSNDLFVEMSNGCICCSIKGDLVESLNKLLVHAKNFEHIVIEATGMANPGPIIETFFSSEELSRSFVLDSVIGLVDSEHFEKNLEKFENSEEIAFYDQIAFSETILLNKSDTITAEELTSIREKVKVKNPNAQIISTTHSKVDLSKVMGTRSFDLKAIEETMPSANAVEYPFSWAGVIELKAGFYKFNIDHSHHNERMVFFKIDEDDLNDKIINYANSLFFSPQRRAKRGANLNVDEHILLDFGGEHTGRNILDIEFDGNYAFFISDHPSHLQLKILNREENEIEFNTDHSFKKVEHFHGNEINSISLEFSGALNPQSFEMFLNVLYSQYRDEIYRSKGILHFYGNDSRVLFQGVYSSLKFDHGREWADEQRINKIVFIGKGLIGPSLEAGLKNCIVE